MWCVVHVVGTVVIILLPVRKTRIRTRHVTFFTKTLPFFYEFNAFFCLFFTCFGILRTYATLMHIINLSLLLNYLEMNYYAFGNVQCMLYIIFYILYSIFCTSYFTFYIFITSKSYCMLYRRTLYTPVVEVYVEVFIIYSNL